MIMLSQEAKRFRPSFVSEALANLDGSDPTEAIEAVRGAAGTMYGAAADTVLCISLPFVHA